MSKFIIIAPFYNCKQEWIEDHSNSLKKQDFLNFNCIYCDDVSETNYNLKFNDERFSISKNEKRLYPLGNIVENLIKNINTFSDDDIIAIVDGDDYLLSPFSLSTINRLYEKNNCLLTYGSYRSSNFGTNPGEYTSEQLKNIREYDFLATHLKTFKVSLFKKLLYLDPELDTLKNENKEYFSMAGDVALMYSLIEIAGPDRVSFNRSIIYFYRIHENNENAINTNLQLECERMIKSKTVFNENKHIR